MSGIILHEYVAYNLSNVIFMKRFSRVFDLNIKMFELHTIYRLEMLDITMMTVRCTLVHVADDEKRLGFMNPTQINQLELHPVMIKKSDMFKGMSKKKRAIAIKKHNKI
jgi:hypothetical protein